MKITWNKNKENNIKRRTHKAKVSKNKIKKSQPHLRPWRSMKIHEVEIFWGFIRFLHWKCPSRIFSVKKSEASHQAVFLTKSQDCPALTQIFEAFLILVKRWTGWSWWKFAKVKVTGPNSWKWRWKTGCCPAPVLSKPIWPKPYPVRKDHTSLWGWQAWLSSSRAEIIK